MKKLLIVYHSQSGSTESLARAAARGAAKEEVEVRLARAMEAGVVDLLWSDALIIATPENFGALAGGTKDFFDRTYYPANPGQCQRRYALIVSAGNDGSGAVRQLERIVSGYPFQLIAAPLIVRGGESVETIAAAEELGQTMAAGLELGIF